MRLSDQSKSKMLQALAHELCGAAHPDVQINMTGWMSLEGEFLVSCASHKWAADLWLREAIAKEIENGSV